MTPRKRMILPLAVLAATAFAGPAFAGTDGDDEFVPTPTPAPFVQPVEAPPAVVPAPTAVVPAPTAAPAPVAELPLRAAKHATKQRTAATHRKHHVVKHQTITPRTRPAAFVRPAVTPRGGVQAGAGGTATPEPGLPLAFLVLLGGTSALALGGTARAFATRR